MPSLFHKNKSQPSISGPLETDKQSKKLRKPVGRHQQHQQQQLYRQLGASPPFGPSHSSHGSCASLGEEPDRFHQQQQQFAPADDHQFHSHPYPQSATLTGSYSHLPDNSSRPTLNVVPAPDGHADIDSSTGVASVPQSPESSPYPESHRKSRRSFFGFPHSKDKEKDKERRKEKHKDKEKENTTRSASRLGRRISVRKKNRPRAHGPAGNPDYDQSPNDEEERSQHALELESQRSDLHSRCQSRLGSHSPTASTASANLESADLFPPPLQRVNTEPLTKLDFFPHQSGNQPQRPQQHSYELHPEHRYSEDQVSYSSAHLDPYTLPRPASQQSFGAPPTAPPPYFHHHHHHHSESIRRDPRHTGQSVQTMQHAINSERPTGLRQPVDHQPGQPQQPGGAQQQYSQPPGLPQTPSFKGMAHHQNSDNNQDAAPTPPAKDQNEQSNDKELRALMQKHEELQAKYIKVKRYYFEKEAQVQQLQNTVAHQRMSAVRTVLDDNEYANRFGRLDGAINNLAFNIRKHWKNVPAWLQGVVNEDAHTVGTKEMTAVGRAFITRLLVDELFNRYFHPSLEPNLSQQLKSIEHNVRRMGNSVTEEEKENRLDRLSFWRRTTLDGLDDVLKSKTAVDNRAQLIKFLVAKLTASLEMNLNTPPPPGLENGVAMIVELAVGIAANIPLESRDLTITYFLPGSPIIESQMKVETTLPPLANSTSDPRPMSEQHSGEGHDSGHAESNDNKDSASSSTANSAGANQGRKRSVFGALMGKKPTAGPQNQPSEPSRPGSASQRQDSKDHDESEASPRGKETENRIRFAAFVAVEAHGKNGGHVIVKAPVYPLA
ncbi:hypothetical protein VTO42DRAFT_6115 [Malbranchea cinnamomea]